MEYSLQLKGEKMRIMTENVTILVLVEYSLQYIFFILNQNPRKSHNPCFSGILFAIAEDICRRRLVHGSQSLF